LTNRFQFFRIATKQFPVAQAWNPTESKCTNFAAADQAKNATALIVICNGTKTHKTMFQDVSVINAKVCNQERNCSGRMLTCDNDFTSNNSEVNSKKVINLHDNFNRL